MQLGTSRLRFTPLACQQPTQLDQCEAVMQAILGEAHYIQPIVRGWQLYTTGQPLDVKQNHSKLLTPRRRILRHIYEVPVSLIVARNRRNQLDYATKRRVWALVTKCLWSFGDSVINTAQPSVSFKMY